MKVMVMGGGGGVRMQGMCWSYVHHGVKFLHVLATPHLCQLVCLIITLFKIANYIQYCMCSVAFTTSHLCNFVLGDVTYKNEL